MLSLARLTHEQMAVLGLLAMPVGTFLAILGHKATQPRYVFAKAVAR